MSDLVGSGADCCGEEDNELESAMVQGEDE